MEKAVTVSELTDRFGNTFWVVAWGESTTQQILCSTEEQRDFAAKNRRPMPVKPMLLFG